MDLDSILQMQKVLDEANIPINDRCLKFIGKDGEVYTAYTDRENSPEVIRKLHEVMNENK